MTLFQHPLRQTAIACVAVVTTALTFGAALTPALAAAGPAHPFHMLSSPALVCRVDTFAVTAIAMAFSVCSTDSCMTRAEAAVAPKTTNKPWSQPFSRMLT